MKIKQQMKLQDDIVIKYWKFTRVKTIRYYSIVIHVQCIIIHFLRLTPDSIYPSIISIPIRIKRRK